jgi:hypothetical protein
MANQTLTQLTQATSASTGDVFYIVTNYESGSPTLTGDSKQIYYSAITKSLSAVTLTNNIDNAILTARGSKPEINGEVKLTFDGSNLNLTGNTTSTGLGNFGSLQVGSAVTGGTATGITNPVYVVATKTSAQTFTSTGTAPVVGWTNEYSNVSSTIWNASNGQFIVPRPTNFRFTLTMAFTAATPSTINGEFGVSVASTTGGTFNSQNIWVQTTTNGYRTQVTVVAYTNVIGSTLVFGVYNQTGVSQTSVTTAGYNRLIIEEIPLIVTD